MDGSWPRSQGGYLPREFLAEPPLKEVETSGVDFLQLLEHGPPIQTKRLRSDISRRMSTRLSRQSFLLRMQITLLYKTLVCISLIALSRFPRARSQRVYHLNLEAVGAVLADERNARLHELHKRDLGIDLGSFAARPCPGSPSPDQPAQRFGCCNPKSHRPVSS